MKSLKVSKCQSLKFVFPVQYSFRSLKHLETLSIKNAPQLNYVFGTNYNESLQNQNDQTQVLVLPALQRLSLEGVPNTLEKVIVQGKPLSTDSKIIKSTDHEGTSKEFAANIPTPTMEMQVLPTSLTELESTGPSINCGKDSIPEGIISGKTDIVPSLIHLEHGDSPSLKEKGKEIGEEFSASNLPLDSEKTKNASPSFLSVLPIEISPHSTIHEESSKELESTRPSNLITKPTSEPNSTNQQKALAEVEKDIKFSHETNLTVREKKTSVEAGHDTSLDLAKDNLVHADVISSTQHQSQIGVIGTSTTKNNVQPLLGIGEIFRLVELKDGEVPLLVKALEQYPQLRLSRQHRTNRRIAFSYRVLVDVLVALATKTPSTITKMDKQALEANLDDATLLGFDKDWIETIRAKVFQNDDMSDVHVVEKEILDVEAKLEACDLALEHVHRQRAKFDDQLMSLFDDRKKLVDKMRELREIKNSKDKPFGF